MEFIFELFFELFGWLAVQLVWFLLCAMGRATMYGFGLIARSLKAVASPIPRAIARYRSGQRDAAQLAPIRRQVPHANVRQPELGDARGEAR